MDFNSDKINEKIFLYYQDNNQYISGVEGCADPHEFPSNITDMEDMFLTNQNNNIENFVSACDCNCGNNTILPTNTIAVSLGYKCYSSDSKNSCIKHKKYSTGARCGNCALFQGKQNDKSANCPIIRGKVCSGGWCTAYVKRGAALKTDYKKNIYIQKIAKVYGRI